MDKEQLHKTLEQLHSELQKVESVDQDELRVLRQLSEDIRGLLEHGGEPQQLGYRNLGERLREGIDSLEASHPNVTLLMGQVADVLAKMGI
ncbi:MAG TPA: DUF4404 family protein [Blastocatellia bacterium]|nr:DUF4404 family protein [Blastocatellia bacterium]